MELSLVGEMDQSRDSLTRSQEDQAPKDTRSVEMYWQLGASGRKTQENICLRALAGRSGSGKRIRCARDGEKETKPQWLRALVKLRVGNRSMNASPSKFPLACTCFYCLAVAVCDYRRRPIE